MSPRTLNGSTVTITGLALGVGFGLALGAGFGLALGVGVGVGLAITVAHVMHFAQKPRRLCV
jgi:hypothetical protein